MSAPIVLVPGFWLGAWAWDEVADALRADGHEVTALTLPGLESADADRSSITLADHVDAICDAVTAAGRPVVLAVHSASGFSGYAASDRIPERIAAMVYVDSAPGKGALDADFADAEKPLVWEDIAKEENLDGLSEEQMETFRQRAVPVPGGVLREGVELTNDARRDIPSTIVCTGFTSEQYKESVEGGYSFLAGVPELRDVTWLDLPTSHWPMWSRPQELAAIIGDVARRAGYELAPTSSSTTGTAEHDHGARSGKVDPRNSAERGQAEVSLDEDEAASTTGSSPRLALRDEDVSAVEPLRRVAQRARTRAAVQEPRKLAGPDNSCERHRAGARATTGDRQPPVPVDEQDGESPPRARRFDARPVDVHWIVRTSS